MNRLPLVTTLFALALALGSRLGAQASAPPTQTPPPPQGAPQPSPPGVRLPTVDLAPLEAKVAEQLRAAREATATLLARPEAGAAERSEALGELAQLYHLYGLGEAATALYARASLLAPADFRWPYLAAHLAMADGDPSAAESGFRRTLELRPDWLPARIHLAEVLIAGNRLDEAEPLLREALAEEPKSAATRAALGQIALSRRQFQAAVEHFEAALAATPEANRLHHPLGLAYRGLGKIEEAQRHLAQAGTVGVTPADPLLAAMESFRTGEGPHLRQGHLLFRNDRPADAAAEFRLALEANPKSSAARIGLASSLSQTGQVEEAIAHLREAVKVAPASAVAHFDLGLLLSQQGKGEEALAALAEAQRLDPGDFQAHLLSGRLLERSGQLDRAEAEYRRAAELAPLDEESQMAAANLLVRRERYAEAVALLTEARANLPRSYRVTYALARLLAAAPDLALRNGAKALPLAEAAYQTQGSPGSAETLAMALAELGRCAEAATRQREAIELAKKAGAEASLPGLEKELARYAAGAAGKPCRPGAG